MDFDRVLARVTEHLGQSGHRWAVAGGLAVQAHGLARTTQDVDLVVEAAARSALVVFMQSLGYETIYESSGFSNHVHTDVSLGRVDFIYIEPATAERLFAACETVPSIGGRRLPVLSAEHLIAMKVHAMKNDPSRTFREMADIQHLMKRPAVDRERVRGYFRQAGLEARYDELLRLL